MKYYKFVIPFLLIFSLLHLGFAQDQNIDFTTITTRQGLSSKTVNKILKDHYGLMWFATDDGLNKFDGTSFSIYRHRLNDSSSIPSNRITALYEDRSGTLWIGTEEGSLSSYDRSRDNFQNFRFSRPFNSPVNAITGDASGKIWIGHYGGLSIVNPARKNSYTISVNSPVWGNSPLPIKNILSLFEDRKQRIWVGTDNGMYRHDKQSKKFVKVSLEKLEGAAGPDIKAITEDSRGNLWIGTTDGIGMLQQDGKNFINYTENNSGSNGLSNNNVYALASDNEGKIWIGTEDGLNILDTRSGAIVKHFTDKRNRYSLTSNSIRCVYIDNKLKIYWLGSFQGGINKYDKNLSLFHSIQSNPFDPEGLVAPRVTAFAALNNNQIYTATDGGGLQLFNRRTGLFSQIPIPLPIKQSSRLSILALEMTKDKNLWIGSYSNGLFLYNPVSGNFSHFFKGPGASDLNHNNIFCITEDRSGNVWIGTNGGGINVYNPLTKTFTKYSSELPPTSPFHLPGNNFIRDITEDKSGRIWIGTHGAGLAVYSPATKTFSKYSKESNLSNNIIVSIFNDSRNNIWVGTAGGGLNLLDKKTNRFVAFTEKDGLANDVVYKILEENENKLWISTNAGICSFDLRTKTFVKYNRYNGVQNDNFLRGSGIRLPDGELYFGGVEGIDYFNPSHLRKNKNIPPVLFTDLKIDNESVSPADSSILKAHISVAREINLDYKQNFSLSFVGINYTAAQQNKYSYILEGFDDNWSRPGLGRSASYTNLDPGKYTFRVKASNNDGLWNNEGAFIKINVKPPFWRTIYAYLFYLLATGSLLFYLRHRTLKKLEAKFALEQERSKVAQMLEQERKEAERVRELDNLKIKFFTNLSHEFRTPISLIMGPVDKLLSAEDNDKKRDQLSMVKRNARRLLNLVNQLLDFRKMEEQELKLNLTEGDIISFIQEVAGSFKDLSERKHINFSITSTIQSLNTLFDHDKVERILFNLLSNAFKFTMGDGAIRVVIEETGTGLAPTTTCLCIKVSDTGIGIDQDKKEKIFDRFFQSSTSAAILNQGTGIGLSITKEFVKMHGGSIEVESEFGKGTTFIINLPLVPLETSVPGDTGLQSLPDTLLYNTAEEFSRPCDQTSPAEDFTRKKDLPLVLLIEDNEDFRFYLKDNLKAYYRIIEASNGKEGWQKALSHHPQLIVSDINMPEMDGLELSEKIKLDKRTSNIPVILLTALAAEAEQIKGLGTGANDYITKPFNFEILNVKIRNLLTLNRTSRDTYTKQFKITLDQEVESADAKLLGKALLYIEQNINDPKLSVEDLSKHLNMSRSTLYSKIRELTGQSPIEYIRNVKLEKAVLLLEKSALTIAEVGYAAGFATPNYFTRAFKTKYHMLPSEYMQLKRKSAGTTKS
ncbi:hybrid sensor histidine kinase/response regulator transcription factor [Desertivirga brevis]|uniref:hybrid sensor histidine kinase/response regulator transcription factor n=1 Tax=Desertivirga brevis TaxID=2810310 RepID=UPI001A976920|nr:hybrid sensor histidine kinase/response regulator transcription factor [Pedobacter sp. SYSU D00873]